MNTSISVIATALFVFTVGAAADVQQRHVDIKASDGVNLKGTYFTPGRSGPAILLLHQCNMDRRGWDELASALAGVGFHVLTVDFRGFGESGGERFATFAQRGPTMAETWPGDVEVMYSYLRSQPAVDIARVAVGGASCGVMQAADLAARHSEIRTLLVLSSATSATDAAKAHIARTPRLAIFGAAAEGDTRAAAGIKEILAASKSPASMLKIYAGTEHGVPMFAKNPELKPMIVTWLKSQLGLQP